MWELVPFAPTHNLIGCKWVFRVKLNADGSISRYKAGLVAHGLKQQYGVDFDQTFSPVFKTATIRTLLTIVVSQHSELRQLDVKNAFLNGVLSEVAHMKQPSGFINPAFLNHSCLLKKSLYGLKQAPRAWFDKVSRFLLSYDFIKSAADSSLFIFKSSVVTIYLLLYVDDIIITGSSSSILQQFIDDFNAQFLINDLGRLSFFLGIEVQHDSHGLFLCQKKYLAGSISHGLSITTASSLNILAYADTDLVGCPTIRRSTSGYCVFFGGNLISWSSKKQPTVARSSSEAKYRALASAAAKVTWILLKDPHITLSTTPVVFCDNISATYLAYNPVQH
ncbi:transmembrane signal receptor [Lithospermum erythrorhizon]|uniref:Transmembrane signal receptor n=1 Tax=Lithospermum erythrorhizon TaxID=34254 RepID=A0AAV3Q1N6_LITER